MARSNQALPFFMRYIQPMSVPLPDKAQLVQQLLLLLNDRKTGLENALATAKESRDNDTKSSAGDKFETGRAMMQQEMDKLEHQRQNLLQQYHQLLQIDTVHPHYQIGLGSLVRTDKGLYFLAIAYGKLEIGTETLYIISTASPLAQLLLSKKVGDSFNFQQQLNRILNIA